MALPLLAVQRTEEERKPLAQPKQDARATVESSPEVNCVHTHSRNPDLWVFLKKKIKVFCGSFGLGWQNA